MKGMISAAYVFTKPKLAIIWNRGTTTTICGTSMNARIAANAMFLPRNRNFASP